MNNCDECGGDVIKNDDLAGYVCINCYNLVSFTFYDASSENNESIDVVRKRKFIMRLLELNLPSMVMETLVDLFPSIENYFYQSRERVNFINMNQLIIELLKITGYNEYIKNVKGIKSIARIKKITSFVNKALFGEINGKNQLKRLDEIELLQPVAGNIDDNRVLKKMAYINIDETSSKFIPTEARMLS